MEIEERRVLRRKCALLERSMPLTEAAFLTRCTGQGLLSDANVHNITIADSQSSRLQRLVESLETQGSHAFTKLCFLLEREGQEYAADELREELLAEKGVLQAQDRVCREVNTLLGKFIHTAADGDSSASDIAQQRQRMCHVISTRVEVAMATGKRENRRVESRVEEERKSMCDDVVEMNKNINDFMKTHVSEDFQRYYGEETFSAKHDLQGALTILKRTLHSTKEFIKKMLAEQDHLLAERAECLMLMKADGETVLPNLMWNFIMKSSREVEKAKHELLNRTDVVKCLEDQLTTLRLDASKQSIIKDNRIDDLLGMIADKDKKLLNFQNALHSSKREIQKLKDEIDELKTRCGTLEGSVRKPGGYNNQTGNKKNASLKVVERTGNGGKGEGKQRVGGRASTKEILSRSSSRNSLGEDSAPPLDMSSDPVLPDQTQLHHPLSRVSSQSSIHALTSRVNGSDVRGNNAQQRSDNAQFESVSITPLG